MSSRKRASGSATPASAAASKQQRVGTTPPTSTRPSGRVLLDVGGQQFKSSRSTLEGSSSYFRSLLARWDEEFIRNEGDVARAAALRKQAECGDFDTSGEEKPELEDDFFGFGGGGGGSDSDDEEDRGAAVARWDEWEKLKGVATTDAMARFVEEVRRQTKGNVVLDRDC